jgi:hypothetical protein
MDLGREVLLMLATFGLVVAVTVLVGFVRARW